MHVMQACPKCQPPQQAILLLQLWLHFGGDPDHLDSQIFKGFFTKSTILPLLLLTQQYPESMAKKIYQICLIYVSWIQIPVLQTESGDALEIVVQPLTSSDIYRFGSGTVMFLDGCTDFHLFSITCQDEIKTHCMTICCCSATMVPSGAWKWLV